MPLVVNSVGGDVIWAGQRLCLSGGEFEEVTSPAPCVRIALVNNMPDTALKDTEFQFFDLLDAASGNLVVHLKLVSLSGVPRSELARQRLGALYYGKDELWTSRFDALIVTGMEPGNSDLRQEPYWDALVQVLDWAKSNTASTILSCLAAHAGALYSDGIPRNPLSQKQFGVFEFRKVATHALTRRTADVLCFPHSRWNEVQAGALTKGGYSILTQSTDATVDLFVKKMRKSLFVHFQGHPEYGSLTLLKEYRRDVRRFLKQERPAYPSLPQAYFDAASTSLLTGFRSKALSRRSVELMAAFPEDPVSRTVRNTWGSSARCIYGNWLQYVVSRKTDTVTLTAPSVAARAPQLAASSEIN